MKYSLEFLMNGSLESEEGPVNNDGHLETLLLRLDAEKFVSLAFIHTNSNILTVSGGRQQYVIMLSDAKGIFELISPSKRGGELILMRTGHSVGKFPAEMVTDTFTALNIIKEFFASGKRFADVIWKPLI